MKRTLTTLILILAAAAAGWYFGHRKTSSPTPSDSRKVAYYQSPMHPWIKSDKPGNCTICGMKLTPVFEGEKGFDLENNLVALSSNAINVLNVQTELVERHPIERTLRVAGKIEAQENRYKVLSAYVDGRIEKLFANYVGAEVEEGEPLAILYSPSLLTAEREYLTVQGETNFSTAPELASEHKRLLEGARLRLRRLGLTDQQIAELPGKRATNFTTEVVAPMSGTVVSRAVAEGQYVKEGDKLFEIADLSQMWFRFDVYEQDLPYTRLGQTVRVTSPALGDKVFQGPITFIDPNINDMSRSARVRVELNNPVMEENGRKHRMLYNGAYANGTIQLATDPVLAVSREAVIDPGDQPRVYVDKGGGAYEYRSVLLGARGDQFVEVRQGLNPGERVVTAGNLLIDSQAQITQSGRMFETGASNMPAPIAENHMISDEETKVARNFFASVDKLSAALASDDRNRFNQEIPSTTEQVRALKSAFSAVPHLAQLAESVASRADLQPADNLVIARSEFLRFSLAVSEFAEALRKHGGKVDVKIYKCPMYPQPGKTAYWVQEQGPLRNPFFGSEMIDCGQEVK